MGERIDLTTKKLAKALDRLHRAAEVRRRWLPGTPEYDRALAEEERLRDEVLELAEFSMVSLAERGRAESESGREAADCSARRSVF